MPDHPKKPPRRRTLASLAVEIATSPLGCYLWQAAPRRGEERRSVVFARLVCDVAADLGAELHARSEAEQREAKAEGAAATATPSGQLELVETKDDAHGAGGAS